MSVIAIDDLAQLLTMYLRARAKATEAAKAAAHRYKDGPSELATALQLSSDPDGEVKPSAMSAVKEPNVVHRYHEVTVRH